MLKRFQSDLPDGGNSAENGAARRDAGSQMRKMTARDTSSTPAAYSEIKNRIQNKLIQTLDNLDVTQVAEIRKVILSEFDTILSEENIILSRPEKIRISEQIIAEILGLGPIQKLLEDDEVTEVMVNGPRNIYVERKGKIQQVPITFESNEHVKQIIDRIVAPLGRRIDESSPVCGRAPARWLARECHHPTHCAFRPNHHHPQVLQKPHYG